MFIAVEIDCSTLKLSLYDDDDHLCLFSFCVTYDHFS